MASTTQYPPPPPPQYPPPYRYRRSIAGPLVLIVIGLVFLLRNLGVRLPIWHWFGHWWPLLLILWGVIRLIEHSMAQRDGYRRAGVGAGSILLLILIVAVGLSAHYSSDIDWGGVRDQIQMDNDLGGIFGTAYTFDDTLQQSFPAKGTLRVVCDHGSLNISPSDDNTLARGRPQEAVRAEPERRQQVQRRHPAADHRHRQRGAAECQHQWRGRSRSGKRHGHLRAARCHG